MLYHLPLNVACIIATILKYYSCSGTMMQESIEVFVEVMIKKTDDNSCLMISSMYEVGVKTKYEKEAKRAIISAKIIE